MAPTEAPQTHVPILDATDRPYESNPFKLLAPSIEAFQIAAIEFLKLFGISILVYIVLGIPAILGIVSIANTKSANAAAVGLILLSLVLVVLAAMYLGYGFTKIMLAAARGHKLPWRTSLPKGFAPAWQLAWTSGIAAIIIMLGLIALIIPGVIFAIRYSQVSFVVVDEGITGMAALKRSQQLVRRRMLDMVGIYGMNEVFNILGNLPLIGFVISLVYIFISMPLTAIRYVQLTQLTDEERDSLPTNIWNYILLYGPIVLFVLFIVASILMGNHKSY